MKITIIYDNTACDERLIPGWGFSCLVESNGKKILFDTGGKGDILLHNMKILAIDPLEIDYIFISHNHSDHTGGLSDILEVIQVPVYVPSSYNISKEPYGKIQIHGAQKIYEHIYSTGELKNIEQSLAIQIGQDVVIVTGCSHPGVKEILQMSSMFGHVTSLVGGLHGFNDFDLIDGLTWICPTHCTQHVQEIAARYPNKYIPGGAGKMIDL